MTGTGPALPAGGRRVMGSGTGIALIQRAV
jgi:hypothetical protein